MDAVNAANENGKGQHIDVKLIRAAVAKANKATKKGTKQKIAKDMGVHPTTLSKWLRDPRYSKQLSSTPKKKVTSSNLKKGVTRAAPKPKPKSKPVVKTSSLIETIANLPTTYEGLLKEHIKLLMEEN